MNVSIDMSGLQSVRQALGIANIRQAMNQDAQSVAALLKGFEQTGAKALELSVTPHKGSNIDVKI